MQNFRLIYLLFPVCFSSCTLEYIIHRFVIVCAIQCTEPYSQCNSMRNSTLFMRKQTFPLSGAVYFFVFFARILFAWTTNIKYSTYMKKLHDFCMTYKRKIVNLLYIIIVPKLSGQTNESVKVAFIRKISSKVLWNDCVIIPYRGAVGFHSASIAWFVNLLGSEIWF